MIATALIAFVQSLLTSAVLFLLGRLLSNPQQLRKFLGLSREGEEYSEFGVAAYWVSRIGMLVQLIAVFNVIAAIYTTCYLVF